MLGPGWEAGCPSCSFLADHFDGAVIHLAQRDVSFIVVSRAALSEIETFKRCMGWRFKWASSFGSDFNSDYQVSFTPQEKAGGKVFTITNSSKASRARSDRAPACSTRTPLAKSFTPIPRMAAVSTS
jgi:predicted dithiol-disulfide oxidoreductase (DUF899 family)